MPIPRALSTEIAVAKRDPHFPVYGGNLLTPNLYDEVIAAQGRLGYDYFKIYEDIERDGHAFAVLQSRKMAVTHREWEVKAASESRKDKKLAEMVKAQLENLSVHGLEEEEGEATIGLGSGFDHTCNGLLSSLLFGFSVGEILWEQDGKEIYPAEIRLRKQRRFGFKLGDRGYRLRLLTRENPAEGEPLPPRKFIVHHHQPEHGPYGLGLGHRLFWPTFFKREDIRFWLLFVDKFAAPTAYAEHPRNASDEEKNALLDALDAIAHETGFTIPEGVKVNLLEAQRSGSINCYESLARWCDEQISEAVLGQTGTTNQSDGGGSRARDEVAERVSLKLSKHDADMLSETLNRTLVRWICHFNDGGGAPPAVWRLFPEIGAQDLNARANRDKVIVDMMGRKPTLEYVTQTYAIELDEPEPAQADPLAQLFGGGGGDASAVEPGVEPEAQPEAESVGEEEETPALAEQPTAVIEFSDREEHRDAADDYVDRAQQAITPTLEKWAAQLQEIVDAADDYVDLQASLLSLFPDLSDTQFAEVLGLALATAEMAGRYEVITEGDDEPEETDLEEFGRAIAILQQMELGEIDVYALMDPRPVAVTEPESEEVEVFDLEEYGRAIAILQQMELGEIDLFEGMLLLE
jgi:phage gp29-like protein